MEKLLDGVEVKWVVLEDERYVEIANRGRKPVKASLRVPGKKPYYGANNIQDYVEGHTHDGEFVLIAEDGSANLENYSIQYATGKFWANNHVHVVRGKSGLSTRYMYHYLHIVNFIPYLTGGGRAKLTKKKMLEIAIPIPPLHIQAKIVDVLDVFAPLTAELTAELKGELTTRKKQYNYYRDQLLTFSEDEVEWKTLREVALEFGRGKSKHRPRNDPKLYGGEIPFIQTGEIRNASHVITDYKQTYSEFGLKQSKLWPKGTLCITIAANIAETTILGFDSCFPDSIIGFIANPEKSNVHFVEYLLSAFKTQLEAQGNGCAQNNIKLATFESVRFPFPSPEEQERIVTILDKFETLINSISQGLSREVELRQKQYEYYRDLLLSFPKSKVEAQHE